MAFDGYRAVKDETGCVHIYMYFQAPRTFYGDESSDDGAQKQKGKNASRGSGGGEAVSTLGGPTSGSTDRPQGQQKKTSTSETSGKENKADGGAPVSSAASIGDGGKDISPARSSTSTSSAAAAATESATISAVSSARCLQQSTTKPASPVGAASADKERPGERGAAAVEVRVAAAAASDSVGGGGGGGCPGGEGVGGHGASFGGGSDGKLEGKPQGRESRPRDAAPVGIVGAGGLRRGSRSKKPTTYYGDSAGEEDKVSVES